MDLDEISRILSVSKSVLEKLREETGDEFGTYIEHKNNQTFWEKIDESLPEELVCELHRMQLQIPTKAKDFSGDFMTPCLEDFFFSFAQKESKEVFSASDFTSIPVQTKEITEERVKETLDALLIWNKNGENYQINELTFTVDQLLDICNEYKSGSEIYKKIPVFAKPYSEIEKIISNLTGNFSLIFEKMRELKYVNSEQVELDIKRLGKGARVLIPGFEINFEIAEGLRQLVYSVTNDTEEVEEKSEINQPNEWFTQRLTTLIEDAARPLADQQHYSLTPSVLTARSGSDNGSSPFEQGSLSELLFTSSTGEVAPIPFSSAAADVPKCENTNFAKFATRRFVAQTLSELGYKAASPISVDVITDVLLNDLSDISKKASVKLHSAKKGNPGQPAPDARAVVMQTLREGKYDIRSLPQNK